MRQTSTGLCSGPSQLLQKSHQQVKTDYAAKADNDTAGLCKQYLRKLTMLRSDLTREGQLDQASVVDAEMTRVKTNLEMLFQDGD